MTKFSNLETRVEKLENVLIEIALQKNRCKYIYQTDLKEAMLRRRIIKEKRVFTKIYIGQGGRPQRRKTAGKGRKPNI